MTNTANAKTATLSAAAECDYDYETREYTLRLDEPMHFEIEAKCATDTEAEALAAQFPKYVKANVRRYTRENTVTVEISATLRANGANGGVNETGVKRYRKAVEVLAATGYGLEVGCGFVNAYRTVEAFEAAIR